MGSATTKNTDIFKSIPTKVYIPDIAVYTITTNTYSDEIG